MSAIFKHLVHNDVKNFGTEFIGRENLPVVDELIDMYGNTVVALLAGSMVRECIRVESVAEYLLRDGRSLRKMFEEYVHRVWWRSCAQRFAGASADMGPCGCAACSGSCTAPSSRCPATCWRHCATCSRSTRQWLRGS